MRTFDKVYFTLLAAAVAIIINWALPLGWIGGLIALGLIGFGLYKDGLLCTLKDKIHEFLFKF